MERLLDETILRQEMGLAFLAKEEKFRLLFWRDELRSLKGSAAGLQLILEQCQKIRLPYCSLNLLPKILDSGLNQGLYGFSKIPSRLTRAEQWQQY